MNNLKSTFEFLGLDYKKEMLKLLAINILILLGVVLVLIFKLDLYILLIVVAFGGILDFLYLSRYSSMKNKLILERDDEFISLLSYFEIFISNNNNVYKSFELLVPYSSEWMKGTIETLLREIDNDKTVQPFINFASKFKALIIESVLISIYQMVEQGESNYASNEFSALFQQLFRSHQLEKIQNKEQSFEIVNSFPLIGAAMLTVIITFCIISIMGDIINVI